VVPAVGGDAESDVVVRTKAEPRVRPDRVEVAARSRYSVNFQPVEFFGAVAIWYLLLTTIWTAIQTQIERKLAVSERVEQLSFWERMVDAWTLSASANIS
jgi:hypothetical protein